jgi:hypothetical protein
MIYYTCQDCQRGFAATSEEEAQEEYEELYKDAEASPSFEEVVETNEVAYAQYCPYCGGTNIEAG